MTNRSGSVASLLAVLLTASWAHAQGEDRKDEESAVPGAERTPMTRALETGAELLQNDEPIDRISMYLVGFHPMKDDPSHQMEAHHYCNQMNEDFAQCVLFDGNGEAARMNGIEYIISEKLFEQLPPEEKRYWHPHNYEILSGQLIAPGIPDAAEQRVMESKLNSYGKTWHVWNTEADTWPLGDPRLAWSFNRDGEAKPELLAQRDRAFEIRTEDTRRKRQDLVAKAKPQCGVDALAGRTKGQTRAIPGVVEKKSGCPPLEIPAKPEAPRSRPRDSH